MAESITQITDIPKDRDTPPHMVDDSIFDQPNLDIPLELIVISGPILMEAHPKLFGKDYILPTNFLVLTLHGIVVSHKPRPGSLELWN